MWRSGGLVLCLAGAVTAAAQTPATEEAPAIVVFALDSSGSLRPQDIETTRRLARDVLGGLPAASRVAVLSFDDQSRILLEATTDVAAVETALSGVQIAGRYTALHDALFDASRYLVSREEPRRAIVLVTDGKDENSAVLLEDGLAIAREQHIPVFAVGVGRIQEQVLRRISRLTGGDYAPASAASGAAIAQAIRALPPRQLQAPTPAPPQATAPPSVAEGPEADVPPTTVSTRRYLLWGALALGLMLAAAACILVVLGKKRNNERCSACGSPLPSPDAPCSRCARGTIELDKEDDGATLLTRSPVAGSVDRTMVLTANPVLRVTQGPATGQVFPLSATTTISVGRSPSNDIVLEDDAISGQHCRFRPEEGRFVLYDLESTNGTYVDDRRVERHPLSEGDVIRVGETLIEFHVFGKG